MDTRKDNFVRLSAAALAALMAGLSIHAFLTKPIAGWTIVSLSVFLVLLAISIMFLFERRTEFYALVGALFSSLVIGRLFSTMHFVAPGGAGLADLDPLMIAETGPGLGSVMYTSTALMIVLGLGLLGFARRQSAGLQPETGFGSPSTNDWGLTFIRLYVGLMFIAHFAGHLFAGPAAFGVFRDYFGSIGLPNAEAFVILAGIIELAVAIGLAFGLMTRIAAFGAAAYLFVSVGLGGHYSAGYVWVLPGQGWEFPALWIFAVSIFMMTGGGRVSLDNTLKTRFPKMSGVARMLLA